MRRAFAPLSKRKAVQAGGRLLALALLALVAGCKSTPPVKLDEWGASQNCHFAHVTKGEFETALRRVFDASRPKVYGLRPEEGGALVERHWALDAVFMNATGTERWRLEYAPAGDGFDVHADVEQLPGKGLSPNGSAIPPFGHTADYHLLWARMAYVLGNRADWPRCKRSNLPQSGLCDVSSSEAPLRLARSP